MKLKLNKQGIISFFPFVALAMLFWVSLIMTKKATYSKDIFIKVTTGNSYIIKDTTIYKANVTLSGKGLDLITVNSYNKKNPLIIKILPEEAQLTSYLITKELQKEIASNKIQVAKVLFNKTFIDIEKKITKRIPVKFNGTIEFKKMYGLKSNIVLKPNKITISGPESMMRKIDTWKTKYKEYKDLDTDLTDKIELEKPANSKLKIIPDKVEIHIPVEEYTEKKLKLPVKLNGTKNKNIKITPSHITVSFLAGISKYEYIDSTGFVATVYLNKDSTLKQNFPVSIIKKPSDVTIQNIQPDYVNIYLKN